MTTSTISESFNKTIREARKKTIVGNVRGYKKAMHGS